MIERLSNNLVLRSLQNENDADRYAAFNSKYNNPFEGATCACLLQHHPGTTYEDYWIVEDEKSGEIVSSTCLIPWTGRYGGVEIRIAQLENVLTHPAYRGQGLVRRQIQQFEQAASERGCDLNIIWGISFFYRQFGYGYGLHGEVSELLRSNQIPELPAGQRLPVSLRRAAEADIPHIADFYERSTKRLDLHVTRDPAYWKYLLNDALYPLEILTQPETGRLLGYAAIARSPGRVSILEGEVEDGLAALAFLAALKTQTPEICLAWPEHNTLTEVGRSLGSQLQPDYQWLLRLPDPAAFLIKIRPVLESRLAASAWGGLTLDFILNFFRQAFKLRFEAGRLVEVVPLGFLDSSMGADGGHLLIPPDAFLRLVFGFRSLDELRDAWPDILIKPEARHLVEVLFPRMESYLHTPYHYLGPI